MEKDFGQALQQYKIIQETAAIMKENPANKYNLPVKTDKLFNAIYSYLTSPVFCILVGPTVCEKAHNKVYNCTRNYTVR